MLSVKESEALRQQLSEAYTKVRQLEQDKKIVDNRSLKIALTKEINQVKDAIESLEEQLKQAPPVPYEPQKMYDRIYSYYVQSIINQYETAREEFLTEVNKPESIAYTCRWRVNNMMAIEFQYKQVFYKLGNVVSQVIDPLEKVIKFVFILRKFRERLNEELVSLAKDFRIDDIETVNKIRAYADILNDYNWKGLEYRLEEYLEHVKSWAELNDRLEDFERISKESAEAYS